MKDFILPDIGEGIVECELLEWLVKEGDIIVEDQPVAEVMTDKATVQIPAMYSGKVEKLYYQAGDIAKVHEPLFAMQLDDDGGSEHTPPVEQLSSAPVANNNSQPTIQANTGSEDFILPDIGEGIVECEVVKWLIAEGDVISEDQPVVEVMTDKALVEIPAKHAGTVSRLYYQQGDIAKVHTPLFAIAHGENDNAQADTINEQLSQAPAGDAANEQVLQVNSRPGKALASPAVRRLAKEQGIDIGNVLGSGKKGRVMKDDLAGFKAQNPQDQSEVTSAKPVILPQTSQVVTGGSKVEPIRGIKAAMAKHMTNAVFSIPHFTVSDELNMDALIAARAELKPQFEALNVKLSFMPFFIKALSMALKAFPIINSQVNEACTELTYFDDHNIGIAVDSPIGLVVPNIKQVQNLSLLEVAQEVNRLIELARSGKLSSADLKGGTISISNVGVLGGTVAVPVINKPESAIVALGKMQRLPRFDAQDNVIAVNIMQLSWSGDHRIIDGATMVRFNNLWMSYLQNPLSMLTELR